MSTTGEVLQRLTSSDHSEVLMTFYCPGCKCDHPYRIQGKGPMWNWDGNMVTPTFTPSLLVNKDFPNSRCHLYVRDGIIEFLGDCHHELKGQKVPMVPLDEEGDPIQ